MGAVGGGVGPRLLCSTAGASGVRAALIGADGVPGVTGCHRGDSPASRSSSPATEKKAWRWARARDHALRGSGGWGTPNLRASIGGAPDVRRSAASKGKRRISSLVRSGRACAVCVALILEDVLRDAEEEGDSEEPETPHDWEVFWPCVQPCARTTLSATDHTHNGRPSCSTTRFSCLRRVYPHDIGEVRQFSCLIRVV